MVDNQTNLTEYNLVQIQMEGVKPFFCQGIRISDNMESEQRYQGASHDPYKTTLKKRNIEFEILEPADHADLQNVALRCRQGESFTIVALGEDKNGMWKALERLEGCIIPSRERTLGNLDAIKVGIKGTAQDSIIINTEFE